MARRVAMVSALSAGAVLAAATVYVLGVRSKNPKVRNAARLFHHSIGNPLQMRGAGKPGSFASVIRHRGRRTGRIYETPVWAVPTEDGFVVAIVYGSRTEWLKNVLAEGTAVLIHAGEVIQVDGPEIVPRAGVRAYFPPAIRRIHDRIHVEDCLRVRRVSVRPRTPAAKLPV